MIMIWIDSEAFLWIVSIVLREETLLRYKGSRWRMGIGMINEIELA